MQTIEQKLDRVKISILSKHNAVFISTVLFSLKFSWDSTIPTACTNGSDLRFNPEWFMELTKEECAGVLVHEAFHVVFQHMLRVHDRDFGVWNQACDHVINLMLLKEGYTLPECGLWDKKYKGMSSDEVYNLLIEEPSEQDENFNPDIAVPGEDGAGTPEAQAAAQQAVEDILIKAATMSKMQGDAAGTIPDEVMIALDKLLNPKLAWCTILNRFLTSMAPNDYSYRKFNKRFLPHGFFLPTLYSESLANITVAVDTSGSVTDEQFIEFISEINAIKEQMSPDTLTVIDFDTEIKNITTLTKDQNVTSITFEGRGGTDVYDLLQWAKKNRPNVLIIFTDGHFKVWDIDPKIPVIWVIHSQPNRTFTYPFGKVIKY